MALPMPSHRRFATLQRAADYVDCAEITLRRMIARGELTKHKVGRVIRIDLDELEAVMRSAGQ